MKKYLKETSVLFIIDILTFVMLWIVCVDMCDIYQRINDQKEMIEFYSGFSFILVGLIIPVLHIVVTIEFLKPGALNNGFFKKIGVSKILIVTLMALFVVAFFVKQYVRINVEKNGYVYCKKHSQSMTFSEKTVFFKDGIGCNDNEKDKE